MIALECAYAQCARSQFTCTYARGHDCEYVGTIALVSTVRTHSSMFTFMCAYMCGHDHSYMQAWLLSCVCARVGMIAVSRSYTCGHVQFICKHNFRRNCADVYTNVWIWYYLCVPSWSCSRVQTHACVHDRAYVCIHLRAQSNFRLSDQEILLWLLHSQPKPQHKQITKCLLSGILTPSIVHAWHKVWTQGLGVHGNNQVKPWGSHVFSTGSKGTAMQEPGNHAKAFGLSQVVHKHWEQEG